MFAAHRGLCILQQGLLACQDSCLAVQIASWKIISARHASVISGSVFDGGGACMRDDRIDVDGQGSEAVRLPPNSTCACETSS
jgi:hypothetical protein